MQRSSVFPEAHDSPLLDLLQGTGGVSQDYHGGRLVRHFGDPKREYEAATRGAAVFDRSHRTRLTVTGRSPRQMLDGVLTGVLPALPDVDGDVQGGRATYHAVLTPKGKMISDAWALLPGDEEDPGFFLDVPVAGREPLLTHFGKFLPPRFAKVADVSGDWASMSVVGPEGAAVLSKLGLGLRVDAETLRAAGEGDWWRVGAESEGLIVSRTCEVWPDAWTVYGPVGSTRALWRALLSEDVQPAGLGVWSTLRIEAGRPVFGIDMDDRTIPPEAGIVERSIDQTKGCYTGQEVIVRIRDRGHVNRQLRRLKLGEVAAPSKGTDLLAADGSGKVVGEITSVAQSPLFGEVLAMAYVRRGVERVRLGETEAAVPDDFPEAEGATASAP